MDTQSERRSDWLQQVIDDAYSAADGHGGDADAALFAVLSVLAPHVEAGETP